MGAIHPSTLYVDGSRGMVQGLAAGTTQLALDLEVGNIRGASTFVTVVNDTVQPLMIDPVVAALRLREDPTSPPASRLGQTGVILEVLSGLFYVQERAEVTVSALLENGRRIVIDDPAELDIQSSNDSIVSVDGNFIVAEEVGVVNLNVSWVVCGRMLGRRIIEVAVEFAQNRPIFENDTQIADVIESAEVGTVITTVFAVDFDFTNSNARPDTEYRFAGEADSHGGLFELDKITGELRLNGPLDRETRDRYVIVIEATDRDQRQAEQNIPITPAPTDGTRTQPRCPGGSGLGSGDSSGLGSSGAASGDCDNGVLLPEGGGATNQTTQLDPPDQLIVSNSSNYYLSVLPRPFQHSGPPCLLYLYFFDVVTKMIDVVTNSAQTTPTHYALNFSWGEPCIFSYTNNTYGHNYISTVNCCGGRCQ